MAAETLGKRAGLTRPLTTGVQIESDDVSKEGRLRSTQAKTWHNGSLNGNVCARNTLLCDISAGSMATSIVLLTVFQL